MERTFGSRLSQLREDLGMTQEDLAKASGVGRVSISRLENDIAETPRRSTQRKLFQALGVSEQEFYAVIPAMGPDGKPEIVDSASITKQKQPATTNSPLSIVTESEEVRELKEQIRELREHNRLLTELLKSDIDLSEIKKVLSFNPGEHSAAKGKQATMWIHGESDAAAA